MEFLDNIGEEPERESNPLIISPTNRSSLSFHLLSGISCLISGRRCRRQQSVDRIHRGLRTSLLAGSLSSASEAAGLSYKLVVGLKLETVKVGQAQGKVKGLTKVMQNGE